MKRTAPLITLMLLTGCDAAFVDPVPANVPVRVQFSTHLTDSPLAPTFAKVNRLMLEFTHAGVVRDTTVLVAHQEGVAAARIVLRAEETVGLLEIKATLAEGQIELFEAHTQLRANRGAAQEVLLEVDPIVDRVSAPTSTVRFSTLRDTVTLSAMAFFANSDVVVGAVPVWTSRDRDIVEVLPANRALPHSNGSVQLEYAYRGARNSAVGRVGQVPVTVTGLAPQDTTIEVGERFQLRLFGIDGSGAPLLPGPDVDWQFSGPITIFEGGWVQGDGPGTAQITFGGWTSSVTIGGN